MAGPVSVVFLIETLEADRPAANRLAGAIGSAFRQRRLEATFKLTGQRAREIRAGDYPGLIDLLRSLDVAYHSDRHPSAPTPSEYVGDRSWADGVAAVFERETGGYEAVAFLTDRIPSAFGNPFFTPQSFAALNEWGTRVYLESISFIDGGERPFFFGGRLNLTNLGPHWIELDENLVEEGDVDRVVGRIADQAPALAASAGVICLRIDVDRWLRVIGGNPGHGLRAGNRKAAKPAATVESNAIERALARLGATVDRIAAMPEASILSARQVADRLADISYEYAVPIDQMHELARSVQTGALKPWPTQAGYLCPAEQLFLLATAWNASHRKGKLVRNSTTRCPLGPAEHRDSDPAVRSVPARQWPKALSGLLDAIVKTGQLPAGVSLDEGFLAIHDLLPTLGLAFERGVEPGDVPVLRGALVERDRAKRSLADECWRAAPNPPGFQAPRQLALAQLQLWTYKPVAVPSGG